MALNEKERCFANEYIINKGNAYQAALHAGYAPQTAKHAYQWLLDTQTNPTINRKLGYKPELKEHIDEQLKQMESEKIATAEEVMKYLTSVMRGESESQIVVVESEGKTSKAVKMMKNPDEKEKLKAADSLAKILGIQKEKIDMTMNQVMLVDEVPDDW